MSKQLKMHSKDLTQNNLEKILELFPNCVSESRDPSGRRILAVNFDRLRQELSSEATENLRKFYQLSWPGMIEAILLGDAPIAKTLRPERSESKNFERTENLFIEGDNLDALKLLQENYLGKIKMIYIDPPYNTGKDFIYTDHFAQNRQEYLEHSLQKDAEGNRLVANTDTNGRFHSDWLSMMLPRLRLTRNLLSEDGAIFISIDENELANLKLICNDIFGEENLIATIVVNKASQIATDLTIDMHEYVLAYAKSKRSFSLGDNFIYTISRGTVGNEDQTQPIISFPKGLSCHGLEDGVYKETRKVKNSRENVVNLDDIIVKNGKLASPVRLTARWRSSNDMRNFFNNRCRPTPAKINGEVTEIYFDNDRFIPQIKKRVRQKFETLYTNNKRGSTELQRLDLNYFDNPKSSELIKYLITRATKHDSIVLDFFAGSGTTADAVMQQNAQDGGNRKFIMVQLPEEIPSDHRASKAGYQHIAEIAKERIRRAGKRILERDCHVGWNKDVGFRALKVDSTNMKDFFYRPTEILQESIMGFVSPIKEDRSGEDLLFQVMLDLGLELNLPVQSKVLHGKEVFFVDDDLLLACFEPDISEALISDLTLYKPLRVIFADICFRNDDSLKTNAMQLFKQRSPHTLFAGF